ncbi:MAG: T9SS type A sorting domain-containing protein [Saprospiraceae bacterium]|nr:T9SS type A sorting domain-containing protein [Lewinella sp.]
MKKKLTWTCFCLLVSAQLTLAQSLFRVQGNGLFTSPASTNLDIQNTDDNTNALIRFGDNSTSKVSVGFNGNDDVFKISTATTLGVNDLTMDLTGHIGINTLPGTHRFLINHNSTSGLDGSAHLVLQENNTGDFARLRFNNLGSDGFWTIAARGTDGDAIMNFFYNDGTNFGNVMSLNGDLFRVGINDTEPEAYLHIKQVSAGINALVLENDDQTGGEKWGMQIGNTNLDYLFEGVIRGSFSSATGAYTAFPPPSAFLDQSPMEDKVLEQVLQLNPVHLSNKKSKEQHVGLIPMEVEKVNPNWTVRSEDGSQVGLNYQQFVVLAIKSVQEQQDIIDAQTEELAVLEAEEADFEQRLAQLEARLAGQPSPSATDSSLPKIESSSAPTATHISQNIPNPFRNETIINFTIPESALRAELQLTDQSGNIVRKFHLSNGQSQQKISSVNLTNGTYFYSLIVDGELVETKQLVVQK